MKNSNRQFVLQRALPAFLLISFGVRIGFADDAADAIVQAQRNAAASEFDQAVFGRGSFHFVRDARARLNEVLTRRIQSVDRCIGLSDGQKKKLELAGRRTFDQLFRSIEEHKQAFLAADPANRQNPLRFVQQHPEINAMVVKLRSAPLDDDSFFGKALRNLLTPEQAAKYDQRSALAARSNRRITRDNAADLVRISKIDRSTHRIVFRPDGKQVGFVEFDKQVNVYTTGGETSVCDFGEGQRVVDFDFSSDLNQVAIGENSRTATIIRIDDGAEIRIDTGQSQPSVKFSPDGLALVTGGYGKEAKLWSATTGKLLKKFDVGPADGGLTPVFSPDGAILAVGHRNCRTFLFDVATGKWRCTLPFAMSQGLCFDPTGKTLAVVYVDGSLSLWNPDGFLNQRVQSAADELYSVDWSPDGSVLVTAGHHSQVTLWDAKDLSILAELDSPDWVICAKFSPDGTRLMFAGGDRHGQGNRELQTWAVP